MAIHYAGLGVEDEDSHQAENNQHDREEDGRLSTRYTLDDAFH
jgi:hypothetical protein